MQIIDWITIAAIFVGPIVAVQLTRYLDDRREIRGRKLQVFKSLMATRAYTVSWSHVEALNRIDLEFDKRKKKERTVLEAWRAYLELLSDEKMPFDQWNVKRVELLVELLHAMAIVLDYDFDKTQIKTSSYSPRAHGDIEAQQAAMRQGTIELLEGKRCIPVYIANPSGEDER